MNFTKTLTLIVALAMIPATSFAGDFADEFEFASENRDKISSANHPEDQERIGFMEGMLGLFGLFVSVAGRTKSKAAYAVSGFLALDGIGRYKMGAIDGRWNDDIWGIDEFFRSNDSKH